MWKKLASAIATVAATSSWKNEAPRLASENMYLDRDGNIIPHASTVGPLSAGMPGVVKSMVYIARKYGKLPLSKSLAPAK